MCNWDKLISIVHDYQTTIAYGEMCSKSSNIAVFVLHVTLLRQKQRMYLHTDSAMNISDLVFCMFIVSSTNDVPNIVSWFLNSSTIGWERAVTLLYGNSSVPSITWKSVILNYLQYHKSLQYQSLLYRQYCIFFHIENRKGNLKIHNKLMYSCSLVKWD